VREEFIPRIQAIGLTIGPRIQAIDLKIGRTIQAIGLTSRLTFGQTI